MTEQITDSQPGGNLPQLGNGAFLIWVMAFFSVIVLTTTYFIEHKLARKKQAQRSH